MQLAEREAVEISGINAQLGMDCVGLLLLVGVKGGPPRLKH